MVEVLIFVLLATFFHFIHLGPIFRLKGPHFQACGPLGPHFQIPRMNTDTQRKLSKFCGIIPKKQKIIYVSLFLNDLR